MNLVLIANILVILSAVVGLYTLIRYARQRVWMSEAKPGKPLAEIGYLRESADGTASEAVLSSGGMRPLGRVVQTADGQSAKVFVLNNQLEDTHDDGDYRERGFISADGIIYRNVKDGEPEAIGYTARPSAPTIPTVKGERRWTSLWLKCELDAYLKPAEAPQETPEETLEKKNDEAAETPADDTQQQAAPPTPQPQEAPKLAARCAMTGVPFQPQGAITNEARACAFATLHAMNVKQNLSEYYNPEAHGWRDVALLTTLIYTVVFMTIYFVNTCLLKMPLLGNDWAAVFILFAYYLVLWTALRQVKIDRAESGHSIQSRLDLINKSLGMGWVDLLIIGFCMMAIYFTVKYYDFDFIPLVMGIMLGVSANRALQTNSLPWRVQTSFREDEEDLQLTADGEEMQPPHGEISKTYDWDMDSGVVGMSLHGNMAIEFSTSLLAEMRMANPYYQMKSDIPLTESVRQMVEMMRKHPAYSERVAFVAHYILRESRKAGLTERQTLQFALDFAQSPNIEYVPDKQSSAISFAVKYVRFPDETLYDKEGDADCKSLLAAMIFFHMGYNAMIVYSRRYKHTAVCVEPKSDELWQELLDDATASAGLLTYNRKRYIYCETTDDGFRLGGMVCVLTQNPKSRGPVGGSMMLDDFETKIEILTNAGE